MPIPTPPGVFPEFNMVFRPGEPCDFSHMRNTIPTRYFDVNERIEQLRSYMNCEMHKNQIDVIKTTIRLYEEGTLDGRWGTHVIIQNGGIVPKDSLQLDKPYWIEHRNFAASHRKLFTIMAASNIAGMKQLSNALATPDQLSSSSSSIDAVSPDLEASIRFAGAQLTQAAGVLLRLSQDIVAQAIVTFTRFWIGPEGGSLRIYSVKDVSAAALYLTAKLSFQPTSPRSVLNVYTFLLSKDASPLWFVNPKGPPSQKPSPESYYLSEGGYQTARTVILRIESIILRTLGFDTHVALPHTIALTYLQTLGVSSSAVARRVFEHLNGALLSPQLLYVTHQPNALAVAAIYLASRENGVKLVDEEWWEVFDVDREELGFLVVGMRSMEGFARAEKEKWNIRPIPMVVDEVEDEIERRRMMEEGE